MEELVGRAPPTWLGERPWPTFTWFPFIRFETATRISRITQLLALALGKLLSPELSSIEEYLEERTDEYHAALGGAGGDMKRVERHPAPPGSWAVARTQPDAPPWWIKYGRKE